MKLFPEVKEKINQVFTFFFLFKAQEPLKTITSITKSVIYISTASTRDLLNVRRGADMFDDLGPAIKYHMHHTIYLGFEAPLRGGPDSTGSLGRTYKMVLCSVT